MRTMTTLVVALALALTPACGARMGDDNPKTPEQVAKFVGGYAISIEKLASQMQQTTMQSPASDDLKAKAMVGFRAGGEKIQKLGQVLSAYDAALKLGQPVDPSEGQSLAEQIRAQLLSIVTLVRGGDATIANQLNDIYNKVELEIVALRARLSALGQKMIPAPVQGGL